MNRQTKEQFREGSFGFHELLDRTSLFADMFRTFICEHTSMRVTRNNKIRLKADKIQEALWDLYQEIGVGHV